MSKVIFKNWLHAVQNDHISWGLPLYLLYLLGGRWLIFLSQASEQLTSAIMRFVSPKKSRLRASSSVLAWWRDKFFRWMFWSGSSMMDTFLDREENWMSRNKKNWQISKRRQRVLENKGCPQEGRHNTKFGQSLQLANHGKGISPLGSSRDLIKHTSQVTPSITYHFDENLY